MRGSDEHIFHKLLAFDPNPASFHGEEFQRDHFPVFESWNLSKNIPADELGQRDWFVLHSGADYMPMEACTEREGKAKEGMRDRTLYEVIEDVCADCESTPGEMAAMVKPWLSNLCERIPCPDNAPLMLRQIADAPSWHRFEYSDPVMVYVSRGHYLLRAAESLTADSWTEFEDLEPCLFLIERGKELFRMACQHVQAGWGNQ